MSESKENPLSERYQKLAYPHSAYDWVDTDIEYSGQTGPLVFKAESKIDDTRWFPTVLGSEVHVSVEANNPKSHRHSRVSEHGGYKPKVTEVKTPKVQHDFDSHKEYRDITGNQLDFDNAPDASSFFKDRMEDVSRERPGFPRSFRTLSRAQFVAELVAGRVMTGQPLSRKPRNT